MEEGKGDQEEEEEEEEDNDDDNYDEDDYDDLSDRFIHVVRVWQRSKGRKWTTLPTGKSTSCARPRSKGRRTTRKTMTTYQSTSCA